jgi:Zn-dependent peptidase ImmA (M78 family)
MASKFFKDKIESKAADFRSQCGLSSDEALNIDSLLLYLNVITIFRPLSENISGMAIKLSNTNVVKRFILINSNHPIGRQNFTICHELYHLFIQEKFEFQICDTGKFGKSGDIEERNADYFASYFLIPKNGIFKLIPDEEDNSNISLSTVLKIEQYFGCSRAAILIRLEDLGVISKETKENFSKNVKSSAAKYGYDLSLYNAGNANHSIGDYGNLAKKLFDFEVISESHYAALMSDLGKNIFELPQNDD